MKISINAQQVTTEAKGGRWVSAVTSWPCLRHGVCFCRVFEGIIGRSKLIFGHTDQYWPIFGQINKNLNSRISKVFSNFCANVILMTLYDPSTTHPQKRPWFLHFQATTFHWPVSTKTQIATHIFWFFITSCERFRKLEYPAKPPPDPKSLATPSPSHMPQPGYEHMGSGERQLAVSGNALDHTAIRVHSQWWETASSQWQYLRPHCHQGRSSVVRDSYQSVAMP